MKPLISSPSNAHVQEAVDNPSAGTVLLSFGAVVGLTVGAYWAWSAYDKQQAKAKILGQLKSQFPQYLFEIREMERSGLFGWSALAASGDIGGWVVLASDGTIDTSAIH